MLLLNFSFLLQDEIDIEFLGKNPKAIQTNYYVNGQVRTSTDHRR